MQRPGDAERELNCFLCLKTLEEFEDWIEITENVDKSIHEIFPLDLISFQSTSTLICEECLEKVETCSSFRSSIIEKHQMLAEDLQSLNVVKMEFEQIDMSAVVIKTEFESESDCFKDAASFVKTEFGEPTPLKKQKGKASKNKSGEIRSLTTSSQNYFEYRHGEHAMIELRHSTNTARSDPDEPVTWEICDKSVLRRSFDPHQRTYSDTRFECDLCGLKFKQRNEISMHMARHGYSFTITSQESFTGKGKIRKFYTLNDLATAKEAVKHGRMTASQAVRAFNIPRKTLHDHIKGKRKSNFEGRQRLSLLEEAELANWVNTCAAQGFPPDRDEVMKAAYEILKRKASDKSIAPVTITWLKNFLKRNPNVNLSKSSNVANASSTSHHNDFNEPKPLTEHELLVEPVGKVECETCTEVFVDRVQLMLHRKEDHPLTLTMSENLEIKRLEEKLLLTKNTARPNLDEPVICEICGKSVLRRSFNSHQKTHDDGRFMCDMCGIIFKQRNEVSRHMASHGHSFTSQESEKGKGKIRKSYTLNDLAAAKEAAKSGGMTVGQAARAFNIPRKTLYDHLTGRRKSNFEGRQRMSLLEEAELADWLNTCAAKGCPRNRGEVMKAAYKILERKASDKSIAPVTITWLKNFLKRNPNVNLSKSSNVGNFSGAGRHNDSSEPKVFAEHDSLREPLGKVECATCQKVFVDRDQLLLHRKEDHPLALTTREILEIEILKEKLQDPEELMNCEICGESVLFKEFHLHKQAHEAHRLKTFICEIGGCEKRYKKASELNFHKRTAHLNQRDFKCAHEGCDKAYSASQKLKDHVKLHHENFRQKCPIDGCTFQVGRRDYMRIHLKKHTELTTSEMNDVQEIVKNMKLVH